MVVRKILCKVRNQPSGKLDAYLDPVAEVSHKMVQNSILHECTQLTVVLAFFPSHNC